MEDIVLGVGYMEKGLYYVVDLKQGPRELTRRIEREDLYFIEDVAGLVKKINEEYGVKTVVESNPLLILREHNKGIEMPKSLSKPEFERLIGFLKGVQ